MIHLRRQLASRLYNTSRISPQASSYVQQKSYSTKPSPPVDPPPKSTPQDPPAERHNSSSMIRQEDAAQGTPHAPDYNVARDYRTSYAHLPLLFKFSFWCLCQSAYPSHRAFSPIPMRVMDGSEPGETVPAAVLSGAPIELQARTVR